jgi:ribonucleoside-diphosphate reductase alpha chain
MSDLGDDERRIERRAAEQSVARAIDSSGNVLRCPECGSAAYYPEGGCYVCRACGFSPCT